MPAIWENRFVHQLLRARDWQDRPELDEVCGWWSGDAVDRGVFCDTARRRRGAGCGVCVLDGLGGAGKTAIVEHFLRVLPGGLPPLDDAAKRDELRPPHALFVFSFFSAPTAESFLGELDAWLSGASSSPAAQVPYNQLVDRLSKVEAQLGSPPDPQKDASAPSELLLILDGLEKIQNEGRRDEVLGQLIDERIRDLLSRIASGYHPRVRAIVTSRFKIADLEEERPPHYRSIEVNRISSETGRGLLRRRGVKGPDAALDQLVAACGGHALNVDLVGGYLAHFCNGRPELLADLGATEAESPPVERDPRRREVRRQELRFAAVTRSYHRALTQRDPAALALLERVCLFRLGVDAAALAAIFTGPDKAEISGTELAALSATELAVRLVLLVDMHLLEIERRDAASDTSKSEVYTAHPAVRDGFVRGLDRDTARRGHVAARAGLEARLAERPGGRRPDDVATLDLLEEIIHHALEAGADVEAAEIYQSRIGGYRNLGWRLGAYERGERLCRALLGGMSPREWGESIEGVLAHARQQPSDRELAYWPPKDRQLNGFTWRVLAELAKDWALFLKNVGSLDDAEAILVANERMTTQLGHTKPAADARRDLVEVLVLKGELTAAVALGASAVDRAADSRDLVLQRDAQGHYAHALATQGDIERALEVFAHAQRSQDALEPAARGLYGLRGIWYAMLLYRLGDLHGAERLTRANEQVLAQRWSGRYHHLPRCHLLLAQIACRRNDIASATEYYHRAFDWAVEHGARELQTWAALVHVQIALRKLEAAAEDPGPATARARRLVEEGLHRAKDCGYAIYLIDLLIESARLYLLCGEPEAALSELALALDVGVPAASGPRLPAAIACNYRWGIAHGRLVRAWASLTRASTQRTRQSDAERQAAMAAARDDLVASIAVQRSIRDPDQAEAEQLLARLDAGAPIDVPAPMRASRASVLDGPMVPSPGILAASHKRFAVALSFPSEHGSLVGEIAEHLRRRLGEDQVFYDRFYEAELARPDLDVYLQGIYSKQARLIAVFICAEYERKKFCRLEWRSIRTVIAGRDSSEVMPFRFDDTEIPGLLSIDGYVHARGRSGEDLAHLILQRLEINARQAGTA